MAALDTVGYWSEVKLAIVKEYAQAYSTIMAKQANPRLHHLYIDGFAGRGIHLSKTTGKPVPGSPLNALLIRPPFYEYHLIDLDSEKVESLRELVKDRPSVHVYGGDCNRILLDKVFPLARFEHYRRALCLLDPYGLHLSWEVLAKAGEMKSVEIFLNFPVMDMNMNVLWHDPSGVAPDQAKRMDAFWGDRSWREAAYRKQPGLFGEMEEKKGNEAIAQAFRKRLKEVAGFRHVAEPIPMRNKNGAVVYYLFFASQRPVAAKIVKDVFDKYRNKGVA